MSSYFLATNVILHHLLADDPGLYTKARAIVRTIEEGRIEAWTSDLAIAEVVFVLSGKRTYSHSAQEIVAGLLPIISLPHLQIPHKRIYSRVFALFHTTLDT